MTVPQNRIFGLDVMRAAAILLVVFDHNADVLGRFIPGVPPGSGIDGVDLFFVLSGYLIGGILLKYAAMEDVPFRKRALDFWQRRWLRTLPNYYLFLLVNIVLVHFGMAKGVLNSNTWGYAFFLQNLWKPLDLFFWESWSLVVEEWYYLIFPAVFFGALFVARWTVRRTFLLVTLLLITACTVIRFRMTGAIGSVFELEEGVRKLAITRMDTIGFGMLAAWLSVYHVRRWERLRFPLLIIGAVGLALNASLYGNEHLRYSATWYFTLGPLAMAALLPALSRWNVTSGIGRPIVFISVVSYALYLVHQPLRSVYEVLYEGRSPLVGVLLWIGYWLICFALAWLIYHFWERRFMLLRGRIGARILGDRVTSSA